MARGGRAGRKSTLKLLGLGAVVFALAWLCGQLPREGAGPASLWLGNAVVLSALLQSRRRRWASLATVTTLGAILAGLVRGESAPLVLAVSLCGTLQSIAVATVLRRVMGGRPDMSRVSNLLRYAAIAGGGAFGSTALAALLIAGRPEDILGNMAVRGAADWTALLVVTPSLIALGQARRRGRRRLGERWTLALLGATLLLTFLPTGLPLTFLVPPALLLVTWRGRLRGAALGILLTLAAALAGALAGRGPFAMTEGGVTLQALLLQAFLVVCFFASLPVAAQSARSRELQERLARALADARDEARKVGMAQSVAHMGYWRFDAATRELSWSPEMFRLFGLPSDATPTTAEMMALIHPDDRAECRRLFEAALLDGQSYEQEVIRLQPAGGGDQYAGGRAIVERDADGSIAGLFGVLFDRTESVLRQRAQDAAETRYRLIAERAHDIILRADLQGRLLYVSPACRALGYEPEEVVGVSAADFIHPEDLPRFLENSAQLLRDGVAAPDADRRHRIRCKDGRYVWVEGNPAIITDDAGAPAELLNVFRDITVRKRTEEELAAKEAKLQLLTDHAPDLLVHIDNRDTIVYASPASRRFGYAPEDLVGRTRSELVHPEDLERLSRVLTATVDSQRTAQAERQYRIRHADGSWVWVEGSLSLVHDEKGVAVGGVSLLRDISERRAAAAALAESEARYRTLADNVTDIIVRFGPDGLVRYISPACRALGLDPDEAVGRSVLEVMAPRQLAEAEGLVSELFEGAEPDTAARRVYEVVGPAGEPMWFEGSPTLVRDESGAVVEVISVLRDVTGRERMEAALAGSEARFRQLAESANDLIMRSDLADGGITYISPSCRQMTGYAPEEVVGRSALDFIHPDDASFLSEAVVAQIASRGQETPRTVEFRLRTKAGAYIWIEAKPTAVIDPTTGQVTAITDVARDVTDRKAMEAELRAARTEAESAAQVKSEFLANMSHELRTPLTSVVGFTKLAAEQADLSPLTRGYIDRVDQAGRALLCAVNDILDFSKLEAGQVSFHPEAVCLPRLAQAALDLFQPQAGAKDLHLAFESDAPADLTVLLDPDRLRQVLLNLISNAVKFTDQGGVTLSLAYDEAAGALHVQVRDSGPGIPEDRLDRLFKRFSQVDGSLTRAHGGTGLGLAICKGIVEAQGGSIGVTSELGEGSVFALSIPAPRVATPAPAIEGEAPANMTFAGVRVLVVDDHPANRELVRLFLSGVGAEVTEAADGEEGVELAGDWPFDLILMDLRMPRLDGAGALARIRRASGPNDATPILAFTADADPDIEQTLQRLGFDGLVAKPVAPAALIAAVAQATAFAFTPFSQDVAHVG